MYVTVIHMAKEMKTFKFKPRRGVGTLDWDTLLNGKVWALTPGEDFTAKPASFKAAIVAMAKVKGVVLDIQMEPDGTIVMRNRAKITQEAINAQDQ